MLKWKHRYANMQWGTRGLDATLKRHADPEKDGQEGRELVAVGIHTMPWKTSLPAR